MGFADDNADIQSRIQQLNNESKQLQRQVLELKKKVKANKASKSSEKTTAQKVISKNNKNTPDHVEKTVKTEDVDGDVSPFLINLWENYVTVTTVPFLSDRLEYNGADLLYNTPSMNEDLTLLRQHAEILAKAESLNIDLDRPMIQMSGTIQGQFYSSAAFTANSVAAGDFTSGITLAASEIDMNVLASSWASGFMALAFNGSPTSTGNREPVSTIYLKRGFLTLGNLNRAPVYLTFGQMYAPFGAYISGLVSTPLTNSMMQIRTPVAVLGYFKNNLNVSTYAYEGSQTSGGDSILKQGGVNATYQLPFGSANNSVTFGGGWVSNIADSQGMQGTGYSTVNNQFSGFAATATTNNLAHAVDGLDANANLVMSGFTLIGEYMSAARSFAAQDLTFDGNGALPSVGRVELDYVLPFFPKKTATTLGISYDRAWEALGLNLEKAKYAVFINTSIWRETIESFEYDYQKDYGTGDTATGAGGPTSIVGTGKGVNTFLLQFGLYF